MRSLMVLDYQLRRVMTTTGRQKTGYNCVSAPDSHAE
jgi:hypothetical protein